MPDRAKDLLKDYFYVYHEIMSAPCEICKLAFHPNEFQPEFCATNCCFPNLNDFCEICNYFKISTNNISWDFCDKWPNNHYIKGFDNANFDYLSNRQPIKYKKPIIDMKFMDKKRAQIAKYFWLYAYIIWGPEKHNEFFNLLNGKLPPLNDSGFNSLITGFSKVPQLSGVNNQADITDVYNLIGAYSRSIFRR